MTLIAVVFADLICANPINPRYLCSIVIKGFINKMCKKIFD